MSHGRERWFGIVAILAVVVAFAVHRVLVIVSAGDFLFPIEPWEGKNTQIAWDLFTGRYGSEGFGLGDYVTNSGAVHHASFSTTSAVYLAVSEVLGFGLLGVRVTPLLFWMGALCIWMETVRRAAGVVAAVLVGVGLSLVPMAIIGWQLTFFGCHSEAVLPLAAVVGCWLMWLSRNDRGWFLSAATGFFGGYAIAFSYLLWPVVGLLVALTVVPPRPSLPRRAVVGLTAGTLAGLWPLWLILLLSPQALPSFPVTEEPATHLTDLAVARGAPAALIFETFAAPFDGFPGDYWGATARPGALWGGARFEGLSWVLATLAPLALLPVGWIHRRRSIGRLALLVGLAPSLCLLFVAHGSPYKPGLPLRYTIPLAFIGWSAPGLAVGIGLWSLRELSPSRGQRIAAWLLIAGGSLVLLWLTPPRLQEAASVVQLGRTASVREHRYVAYYNLGIGTIWSEQVPEVNDLLDVRASQGHPGAFAGIQAGLLHDQQATGLPLQTWTPRPLTHDSLLAGLHEWRERQSYLEPREQEYTVVAAENIGWGVGIRGRWNGMTVSRAFDGAFDRGKWPRQMAPDAFWEGYGMGWGRASAEAPEESEQMPRTIPETYHQAVARGVQRGRAIGEVPETTGPPPFRSIRKPAQ